MILKCIELWGYSSGECEVTPSTAIKPRYDLEWYYPLVPPMSQIDMFEN